MNKLYLEEILSYSVYIILFIIFFVIHHFLIRIISKFEVKEQRSSNIKTYLRLLRNVVDFLYYMLLLLLVLDLLGFDVSTILTSVSIASVIIGFAVQDLLKDIIRGVSIITDNYFKVGDIVRYDNKICKVISIDMRSTKFQNMKTLDNLSVSNRKIEEIEVLSHKITIDIPLSYELSVEQSEQVVQTILELIRQIKDVETAEYLNISELGENFISYHVHIYCDPNNRYQVIRDVNRAILIGMEKHNVSVPYNQLVLHGDTSHFSGKKTK